jgi:hypothetical protein
LIFIVFYFSSTSGDYVRQYLNLEKTQKSLNEHLRSQLNAIDSNDQTSILIKQNAILVIKQIDKLTSIHDNYIKENIISEDQLKDKKFVNGLNDHQIKDLDSLQNSFQHFIELLPLEERKKIESDLGISNEKSSKIEKHNIFIKDAPTGVFGSIIQHYKTVVLSSALEGIQKSRFKKIKIVPIHQTDSSFLIGFNNTFNLGDLVRFNFYSPENKIPEILIGDTKIEVNQEIEKEFYVNWIANRAGTLVLMARLNQQVIKKQILVLNPKPSFLENKQEIACFINEPITLKLERNSIRNQGISFSSSSAQIERKADELIIIPQVEGKFTVEMKLGETVIDKRVLFAGKGESPQVILKDIIGSKTNLNNAHCLESVSPEWQVVNFNFITIDPNGITRKLKSNTRFLRNELRTITNNLPNGSTIIFDQIRLLNKDGIKTCSGSPIFIEK